MEKAMTDIERRRTLASAIQSRLASEGAAVFVFHDEQRAEAYGAHGHPRPLHDVAWFHVRKDGGGYTTERTVYVAGARKP
jgi:hypothetical protein